MNVERRRIPCELSVVAWRTRFAWSLLAVATTVGGHAAEPTPTFDGSPWNVSTGNLSVSFIQASPIGAFPQADYREPPPTVESQVELKKLGLVANEDYIAWGAVERQPDEWSWEQHDAIERTLHEAGLKYVVYNWVHFPPTWLRERPDQRTLMRCAEHGQECNYLSIFDPRTIAHYDHFYKNLHAHFGERIDNVYACILGPYGEGNYPIQVPGYIDMGHCHEGYWCGDEHALRAFQTAMQERYGDVAKLNEAWGASYASFADVRLPAELSQDGFAPSSDRLPTATDRREWLDFIAWYHQAIIDFAEQSLKTVLKYFPAEKVRLKPGGNYGSVNPLPWGTYCPGYAKMANRYGVVLQPADCQGAVFGDKWMATAYQFYGVKFCTEPASNLIGAAFNQRMFSDAACGASEFFTYEFARHAPAMQRHIRLYTGKPAETEIAVLCPTTLYRLGANLHTTIKGCVDLRDLTDFDVLDELLLLDGALTTDRYKVLMLFQADIVEQAVLDQIDAFRAAGGEVIAIGDGPIANVEGNLWSSPVDLQRVAASTGQSTWLAQLSPLLADCRGFDGLLDGVWTARRGQEIFLFNSNNSEASATVNGRSVQIPPTSIFDDAMQPALHDEATTRD